MPLTLVPNAPRATQPLWNVSCPICSRAPGEPCVALEGHVRNAGHIERTWAQKALTIAARDTMAPLSCRPAVTRELPPVGAAG